MVTSVTQSGQDARACSSNHTHPRGLKPSSPPKFRPNCVSSIFLILGDDLHILIDEVL